MKADVRRKATPKGKGRIVETRRAGKNHAVIQVVGARGDLYRREPCATCPWRVDAVGEFPAEAFRISASTSYDMSQTTFACHESGSEKPATCAGFLLRAEHNFTVRMKLAQREIDPVAVSNGGHELHEDYRAMAVANGVDADDPVLRECR